MARTRRFTIYDVLDEKGYFDSNPANPGSRDNEGDSLYSGPVEFPKMLYHPEGATVVTVPAEVIVTPLGPKSVGEQRELVSQIARNASEEAKLVAEGWHRHPADAVRAGGGVAPPKGASDTIADLQAQIARLQQQANDQGAEELAKQRTSGAIVRTQRAPQPQAQVDGD
jgi:hypothetical protein